MSEQEVNDDKLIEFVNEAFRNVKLPHLSDADMEDIRHALSAFASRTSSYADGERAGLERAAMLAEREAEELRDLARGARSGSAAAYNQAIASGRIATRIRALITDPTPLKQMEKD